MYRIESSLMLILCSCEMSKLFFDQVPFQSNACQLKLSQWCRFVDLMITVTKTIGQRINWKPRKGIEKNQEHIEYRGGDCCGVYCLLSATYHRAMKCMVLSLEHGFIWNRVTWKRFINQDYIVYHSVEDCWSTTGACHLLLHHPMKSCILQHEFISKPVCTWKEVTELRYLKDGTMSYNTDIESNACSLIARAISQTPMMGTLESRDICHLATIGLQHNTVSRKEMAHVNEKYSALDNNNLLDKTALVDKFYCYSIEISMAIEYSLANKENSHTIPNKVDTTAILFQSDYINHLLLLPKHIQLLFVKFLTQVSAYFQ